MYHNLKKHMLMSSSGTFCVKGKTMYFQRVCVGVKVRGWQRRARKQPFMLEQHVRLVKQR